MAAAGLLTQVTVGQIVVYDMSAVETPEGRLYVGLPDISFLSRLSCFDESGGRLTSRTEIYGQS